MENLNGDSLLSDFDWLFENKRLVCETIFEVVTDEKENVK